MAALWPCDRAPRAQQARAQGQRARAAVRTAESPVAPPRRGPGAECSRQERPGEGSVDALGVVAASQLAFISQ